MRVRWDQIEPGDIFRDDLSAQWFVVEAVSVRDGRVMITPRSSLPVEFSANADVFAVKGGLRKLKESLE